MTIVITGGCGFVGSNIAHRLLSEGREVVAFDNLSRIGSRDNLEWLRTLGLRQFIQGDIRDRDAVENLVQSVKPQAIFHLSGQVAMTSSLENPRHDFEVNVGGTINLLESVRQFSKHTAVVYASSNKVYGNLGDLALTEQDRRYTAPQFPNGIDESAPLEFQTPYGCSKGAADQYMLDYARIFGLKTAVFRHSTIYGGRQRATFDQGWVGWFCQQAWQQKNTPDREAFTISGDGKQVRDLLYVDDAVSCYLTAMQCIDSIKGQAFNIGGGIDNSCSLLELFDVLEKMYALRLNYHPIQWRQGDQKFFVANTGKATRLTGWKPQTPKAKGIAAICAWVEQLQDKA